MSRVSSVRAIILAVVLALAASTAFAQSDLGTINGFVKDPSGSVVPNAKVTVKNESGLERQSNTNESGFYTITNIPPGPYRITVEAAGFKLVAESKILTRPNDDDSKRVFEQGEHDNTDQMVLKFRKP